MNLPEIQAFIAVAETGSVNRAAAQLRLTQPAITRRIQNFEAALGNPPLFDRSVKPAVLTGVGNQVLEHCRRVINAVADLETAASDAGNPAGDLRVGVAHGLEGVLLTGPLQVLRERFQRLRLQVAANWTAGLLDQVRSGELDCAVVLLSSAHVVPRGVSRLSIASEKILLLSSSLTSTRLDRKPWHLRDLASETWILNPLGCGCRAALCAAFDRQRLSIFIGAEVFGEELQMSLLSRSGGVGLVPRLQFRRSEHRHSLNVLELVDFDLDATVALVRREAPGRFDAPVDLLATELKALVAAELA
ncbi:MAG TPA: LysR family transcriptional regulator [Devosiaceae bacterium]|jgi:DNA-binding transcriptional LysR family regulator|nr:LysR family transcriptional regulator [Devosiaceae bacterium]